jgi:effector-binding domain-containing protein
MKVKYIILFIILLIFGCAVAWGPIVSNVEHARYDVVEAHGDLEIRDYAPMIVAEVDVSGERKEAISKGFRMIADYIFGNNVPSQKVAMTAPVTQQSSEKIAMTAPVTQQGTDSGEWKVHFGMPSTYTMNTLPKPNNHAVKLKEVPAKRYAVIRFSGIPSQSRIQQEEDKLEAFLKQKDLQPLAKPIYAFFNPPWTLPFMRRNEVMIEIGK